MESLKPHSMSMAERFAVVSVLMLYNGKRLLAYLGRNTIPSGRKPMGEWFLILLLAVAEDQHSVSIGPMGQWTCGMAQGIIEDSQVYIDEDHATILAVKCVDYSDPQDD